VPATLLDRISANPATLGGKPCLRDTRVPVELVLRCLADGQSNEDIRREFPLLEDEDVRAAIAYAHAVVRDDSLDAVRVS